MNGKILGFLTAVLMAAPMAANAQFTYDFTGVITSSNQDLRLRSDCSQRYVHV